MSIKEEKNKLRAIIKQQRDALDKNAKKSYDQKICENLFTIIKNNSYKVIHCYLPMSNEINITPLIEKLLKNKLTVITPKTLKNRKLKNLRLTSLSEIETGIYNTLYPSGDNEFLGDFDLVIVPGLAFDSKNYRLGYGGGYYDSFLTSIHKTTKKIGIAYPFQKVASIPKEPHDAQLDQVLCYDKL